MTIEVTSHSQDYSCWSQNENSATQISESEGAHVGSAQAHSLQEKHTMYRKEKLNITLLYAVRNIMYARGIVLFPGFSHEGFPGFKEAMYRDAVCRRIVLCTKSCLFYDEDEGMQCSTGWEGVLEVNASGTCIIVTTEHMIMWLRSIW